MATIRAYTDLEQSKKLAKILPPKSADMFYIAGKGEPIFIGNKMVAYGEDDYDCLGGPDVLCWSLTALFGVLPMIRKCKDIANPFIAKTPDNEYYVVYATLTEEVNSSAIYDNPVDACVTMIERLHELNVL